MCHCGNNCCIVSVQTVTTQQMMTLRGADENRHQDPTKVSTKYQNKVTKYHDPTTTILRANIAI